MEKKRFNYEGLFRAAITIGLLVLLFTRISVKDMIVTVINVQWPDMAAAILLTLIAAGLNTWKWQILLGGLDIKISYHRLFYLFLVGFFFNNLLLSGTGDLQRIYALSKKIGHTQKVLTSVLLERWTGAVCLLLWVCISLAFAVPVFPNLGWLLGTCIVLFISGFLFLPLLDRLVKLKFFSRFSGLKKFLDQMPETSGFYKRPALWYALGIALIAPFIMILLHYILGRGVGIKLPFIDYLRFIPTIMAISYLPISVNGLGVQESGFYIFFTLMNIKGTESLSLSILSHLAKIAVAVLGGLLFFVEGFKNGSRKTKALPGDADGISNSENEVNNGSEP